MRDRDAAIDRAHEGGGAVPGERVEVAVVLGEDDPSVVSDFMGFSYETSLQFFDTFLRCYLQTDDENRLREVKDKATLLCYTRLIRKVRRSGLASDLAKATIERCLQTIEDLTNRLDTLEF